MIFKRTGKISKQSDYQIGGRFNDHPFGEICKNCGYPNGDHYMSLQHKFDICPDGITHALPEEDPEWFNISLNKQIKIL